ncbi:MAG: collagen binding domain-containing protein [Terriglobia bacterium]
MKDGSTLRPLAADVSIVHLEGSHTQLFHARTDTNGWYQARSLPPGSKILIARAEGFGFAVREVVLESGQILGPVNFELEKAASVQGLVVDEQGLPLEGATVRVVYPDAPPVVFGWMMSETVTRADGAFNVKRVTPNRDFYLEASHREFPVRFSASSLRLAPDEDRPGVPLQLRRGLRLSGQVVDSAGSPLMGAEVRLIARQLPVRDPTNRRSRGLRQEIHRTAKTDSRGRFAFEGLGNGARVLLVRHPNYETKKKNLRLDRTVAPRMEIQVTLIPKAQ